MDAPRRRNAAATKERILRCAQEAFHDRGYEGATIREIAARAEVNLALINRYFGTKLGLFEEAVLPYLSLQWALDTPASGLGERLADFFVRTEPKERFDAFVVLMKSASSPEAGPLIIEALERQALKPLAEALDGNDVEARAILIATQLAGLVLLFRALRRPPRSEAERDAIRVRLSRYLHELAAENASGRPSTAVR